MKKQIVIAIVAILLTAVLLAPTVMASAVRDGNSVQYSSHRGLNYITDKSVTASNQPYITLSNGIEERETSSLPWVVKNNIQPGMRAVKGKISHVDVFFVYSADGELLPFIIGTDARQLLKAAPLASM